MIDLKEVFQEVRSCMHDISADFVSDYNGSENTYICDAFTMYSDSYISVYTYDLMKYLSEHPAEVEEVIDEYGWDGVGRNLTNAVAYAWIKTYESELYNDKNDIIRALIIKQLIAYDIIKLDSYDVLDTMLDDVIDLMDDDDSMSIIQDYVTRNFVEV